LAPPLRWDVFCRVIDNWGDAGVSWRLCADLAARGHAVRLWIDQPEPLRWMAPQCPAGIQVKHWRADTVALPATDVVVETFGCGLEPALSAMARRPQPPIWINLEYLSAEGYVARSHGLPSPQAQGLTRHFYFPGFSTGTGGLLREAGLAQRQRDFDAQAWLHAHGLVRGTGVLASLFCYEPAALLAGLHGLAALPAGCHLLLSAGRSTAAVQALLAQTGAIAGLRVTALPLLNQHDFDHLLWACDLNFVRGEDSLVRALWAGKPLIWQAYPQSDQAHHAKLHALLDTLALPASQAQYHRVWNGMASGPLPVPDLPTWARAAQHARAKLAAQTDLCSQLIRFVQKIR